MERVAVGQSFEHRDVCDSLFTVIAVKKDRGFWHVFLLCVTTAYTWRAGQVTKVITTDGTLSLTPFERIG